MDLQQQVNGFLDSSKLQGAASKDPPNGIRQLLEKKEVRRQPQGSPPTRRSPVAYIRGLFAVSPEKVF
jgi:hypothetical protein